MSEPSRTSALEWAIAVVGLAAAIASGVVAWHVGGPYGEKFDIDPRVKRTYNATGDLTTIAFDSDGDLRFDTWSYVEHGKQVRLDSDDDQDGHIDRRQYFGPTEALERTEFLNKEGRVVRTEKAK